MPDTKQKKITFFSNEAIICPVCNTSFYREDLLSGGGRLIAGDLTDELRRRYEPSAKFGEIHPLIYPITVCPSCYYAVYAEDFLQVEDSARINIKENTEERKNSISVIFDELDFTEPRRLFEGVASYFFAVICYEYFHHRFSPTFKRAVSTLRAAWLLSDLHRKFPEENYDYLSQLFYRKAYFFYTLALEKDQKGKEELKAQMNFGPDLDKNYGYNGLLYVAGVLEYKYGPKSNTEKRIKSLENAKRYISKLFGLGKASKNKPSAILDKAKEFYNQIGEEIKKIQGEVTNK